MISSRAAVRYAKALLQQAKETQVLDTVATEIKMVLETINENTDFQAFLGNPTLTSKQKAEGFKAVFANLNPLVSKTFKSLLANKRAALLSQVCESFLQLFQEEQGKAHAVVTSAVAMSESLSNQIQEKVSQLIHKQVTLTNQIDPSLMGGFVLRVGDLQYNASVAAQLQQLEREFTNI